MGHPSGVDSGYGISRLWGFVAGRAIDLVRGPDGRTGFS